MPLLRPRSVPPPGLTAEEFLLEPLRTAHVDLDYEAVMESRVHLRDWNLSDWPTDDFTVEGNRADLAEHQREHEEGRAFTYTILAPNRSVCLGCVYVMPLAPLFTEHHLAATGDRPDAAARVAFWVRESRLAAGLDRRVLDQLTSWFEEGWDVDRAVFFTSDRDKRQQTHFDEAGLCLVYRVPVRRGEYLAYL